MRPRESISVVVLTDCMVDLRILLHITPDLSGSHPERPHSDTDSHPIVVGGTQLGRKLANMPAATVIQTMQFITMLQAGFS